MKKKLLAVALALAGAVGALFPAVALAANPEVGITVYGDIIAITNSQDTWAVGHVTAGGAAVYFSADGSADPDYSLITNTGNQAVDIQIQGTDLEGGDYDWTLGAAAGDKVYQLYANTEGAPTVYDVEVKSSSYVDLTTNLAKAGIYDWSMEFTPPTVFDAADDGGAKTGTVTLVARLHT